jgi:von Willebrand factor type A domain/Aerotolerance regulator N-terminal
MSVLHPALLWLLPLAAIPILLHLLTLHRLKTVELSTFRFLFDSYVQQRRRMQFMEALLAMLRTAFLLFLVLVICRPAIKHWNELFNLGGSGRDVVLLVDCSASMNARTAGVAAIDRARSAALSVAERLGPEDRLTLVRVVSRPEEIFSRFTQDAATIRDKIEGLKTSPARGNLYAALTQVFGSGSAERRNALVYLFTDCQASGWREVREQGVERLVPEGTQFLVVNVGSRQAAPNLAVAGDVPRRNRVIAGLPVVLQSRVVNYSKTEPADVTLSVLIDDKEIARSGLTLKPGETSARKIIYTPTEPGELRGRFEISGRMPDFFPDDDRFLFTLSVVPRVKVLLVNGNPAADPFENDGLYLRTALTSTPEGGEQEKTMAALGAGKSVVRSLDVQEIPEYGINPEVLRQTSVVILSNCGNLDPQRFVWLREYVLAGGGLLIFPGDRVNPDAYETQFFTLPAPQKERFIAATMKRPEGDPEKSETFERLAIIDFAHPVLSVFEDPDARYLRTCHFARRFPITLAKERENTWPLAEFTGGAPALVESRFGEGRLVLAAFPAHARWTNLPLKPEFVPLVLRLVSYLQHRPPLEVPSVVPADGVAEVSVAGTWAPAAGKVSDPAGRATPLELNRSGSRLLGAFERTAERGYYSVEVTGGQGAAAKAVHGSFAVNLAPEESDQRRVDQQELAELLPTAKVTLVDASAEAQQLFGAIGDEHEIWRPLIFVLFVIIAVEFTLATLSGQRREGEEPLTVAQRIRRFSPGTWVGRMTGAGRT